MLATRVALLSSGPTEQVLGAIGIVGLFALVVGVVIPSTAVVGAGLAGLGGQYCLQLVLDDPPADTRAAVIAAALLSAGELAFWSIELRQRAPREPGRQARRLGFELSLVLAGLVLAAVVLAVADVGRVGGGGIEVVGGVAAIGLLGLAVSTLRPRG